MNEVADAVASLATRTHLVCRVQDHRFAVAAEDVIEVHHAVAVTPLPGAPESIIGSVDLRGRFVAVLDVRRRLGLSSAPVRPSDVLVHVEMRGQPVLMRVDAALSVTSIAEGRMQHADDVVPGARYLRSVTTGDDGPLVVHDLDAFLSATDVAELEVALQRARATHTTDAS